MLFRPTFSLRYFLLELLMLATAMGLTKALSTWLPYWLARPGDTTIPEVMAMLLCLFAAAAFWGAAIGGLFGCMKIGGRIAAYLMLLWLIKTTLAGTFGLYYLLNHTL